MLFVAVPDEEANSAGARVAAPALAGLALRHRLRLRAAINLDAIADDGDGSLGRVIAMGSVGKLLPTSLVIGRPAHASYAFRGLGAAALAGALAAEMEWLPALTERYGGETTAGPTLLGMKDTRQGYDVTMPERVWMYWNIALVQRTPEEVLALVAAAADRASAALLDRLEDRRRRAGAEGVRHEVRFMTYAELFAAVSVTDPQIADRLQAMALDLAADGQSLPEQSRVLTERLWDASGLAGPAIIFGFGSTPYVPVLLGETGGRCLSPRAAGGRRGGQRSDRRRHRRAPVLSGDFRRVSFFGDAKPAGLATIAANTPMWEAVFGGKAEAMTAGLPTVNIGPWGRDYHSRLERVDTHYAFEVLPQLLLEVAAQLFSTEAR